MGIKLDLSEQMIQVIGASLAKQPFEIVAATIAELQRQIDVTNTATEQAPQTQSSDRVVNMNKQT